MINFKLYLIAFTITLILTIVFTKYLIPVLKRMKIGQKILDIGPKWHKDKEGTPTMGGIAFVLASIVAVLLSTIVFNVEIEKKEMLAIINVFVYSLLNCFVGLIDDISKIRKAKNEGLTPIGKLTFQAIFAILFLTSMKLTIGLSTVAEIPFTSIRIDLGNIYYLIAFLLLCGMVNAVNLTDGIDGLASTCVLTVGAFLTFASIFKLESSSLSIFGAILTGSTLGFLVFNLHPAKIFMGDTGSLFFGSLVAAASFVIGNPFFVIIYGFVFICEATSDILQVAYFKITRGKRLFKMAPLHHHLEKSGYSEMKIVSILGIINAIFCLFAYLWL